MRHQNMKKSGEQEARTRLQEAGIALFAEKGYASASVREIVERAGVTKPVLYYYFKNKEGMFRAILDWAAEQHGAILAEVVEMPGTALDHLIHLYNRTYQGVMENQGLFKMIHNLIFGPPQGAPDYDLDQYQRRMVNAIKAIYLKGLSNNEVKEEDPEEVAILVLSLMDLCFHMVYVQPESFDPDRPERLLRLLFQGVAR